MTKLTHFVDLTVNKAGDVGFILAKLVHGVHSFIKYEIENATEQYQVAIALPGMNAPRESDAENGANVFVGRTLRVFSSEHLLNKLKHYPAITPFLRNDVSLTPARPLPSAVKAHAAYRRLRSADKETASALERINRRRAALGAEPHSMDKVKVARRSDRVFLSTSSATQRRKFSLFIVRDEKPAQYGPFNSYGLSKGGTVPSF